MYWRLGTPAFFADTGLARREIFGHQVGAISKQYPDSSLSLERRGMSPRLLQQGRFKQLNLYTTDLFGLPDELFSDREINWTSAATWAVRPGCRCRAVHQRRFRHYQRAAVGPVPAACIGIWILREHVKSKSIATSDIGMYF
jgi:hypothetical protein